MTVRVRLIVQGVFRQVPIGYTGSTADKAVTDRQTDRFGAGCRSRSPPQEGHRVNKSISFMFHKHIPFIDLGL
ncbi:hypothetical protein XELAEV_18040804mg [Xenopus laevis]|uniref:Uncharacterized protein n=1 Tax=Xenopus laevis TaxID=8355 RepID=A0A974CAF8_XENLA|nr:hypothetical protein XELAEV_18040804mg [Xenopus laevis]